MSTDISSRTITDVTSVGELFDWHRSDSPTCGAVALAWHTEGFGCRACGWLATDEEES